MTEGTPHRPRPATSEDRDRRILELLCLVAVAAILVGIRMLDGTVLASSWSGALRGVLSQLPVTVPAGLVTAGAAAVQLTAGAVLMRLVRGSAYHSVADAVLAGLVGAVAISLANLFLLGGLGWFRQPPLLAVQAAVIGLGWFARPLLRSRPKLAIGPLSVATVLVAFAWSGAILMQLASPVVPFLDVLPNHVAPAEHLRTFGDFATLTIAPSPIYGPSRMFLGYTALMGTTTTLTGLPAVLTVAAFILPAVSLVGLGMVRLATAVHGPALAWWMLLVFTLTASFARLADDRATVLVLPIVAFCLVELIAPEGSGRPIVLAIGLAAAVFVHPLMGVMTVGTIAALVALKPARYATLGVPALVGGALLALPQAITMLGVGLPSVLALAAVPPALAGIWLLQRFALPRRAIVLFIQVAGTFAVLALVGLAVPSLGKHLTDVTDFVQKYPILAWTVAVGLIVAGRQTAATVPVVAFGVGFLGVLATTTIPFADIGVLGIGYEVAKTLHYWIPIFLAILAAFALHALWTSAQFGLPLRTGMLGLFLVAAVLPIRSEVIPRLYLGEHRLSETLSIDLGWVETGYWQGYPDSRTLVDADEVDLINRLRQEIAAGRLTASTRVLHVSFSFQQWVSTPLGVFAGIMETAASQQTEVSSHTAGGRLFALDALDTLLRERFGYVLFEPTHLPVAVREQIVAAGYQPIYRNPRGEIFVASRRQ
jgi:hypothetical protein